MSRRRSAAAARVVVECELCGVRERTEERKAATAAVARVAALAAAAALLRTESTAYTAAELAFASSTKLPELLKPRTSGFQTGREEESNMRASSPTVYRHPGLLKDDQDFKNTQDP